MSTRPKKQVTVIYLDGREDVYEAVDLVTTEPVQWRLLLGAEMLLVPMCNVRSFRMRNLKAEDEKGTR